MTTPVYGWSKPTVGGSSGTWGTILNSTLDDIDADLDAVDDRVDALEAGGAKLPLSGGTMTGVVTEPSNSASGVSGTVTLDLNTASVFYRALGGATTFQFSNYPTGSNARRIKLLLYGDATGITYGFSGGGGFATDGLSTVGNSLPDATYHFLDITFIGNVGYIARG